MEPNFIFFFFQNEFIEKIQLEDIRKDIRNKK